MRTTGFWKKSLKIPNGVIRIRISKKDRQHNGQKKKYKKTNNDLQNTTQKTKDRTTRTQWGWTQVLRKLESQPRRLL
jgi:hypothetical protein